MIHVCRKHRCPAGCFHISYIPTIHCPSDCVAIIQTCRQVNAETALMSIGLNTFSGAIYDLHITLIEMLNQAQLSSIESICVFTVNSVQVEGYRRFVGLKEVKMFSKVSHPETRKSYEDKIITSMYREIGFSGRGSSVKLSSATDTELDDMSLGWLKQYFW